MTDGKKTIRFTVTEEQYALIRVAASARGMRVSQFAKTKLFDYVNRHTNSGVMAKLAQIKAKDVSK